MLGIVLWTGGSCATTAPATPTAPEPDSLTTTLEQMARSTAAEPVSWQTTSSANFTLHHHHADAATVQSILREAERRRIQQLRWWGQAVEAPWQPTCDIYLYPTRRQMQRAQQGRHFHAFALARSARLAKRLMLQRQINLFARDRFLTRSTLPHELSHVVLTELLANRHVPRWADEGLATHWESRGQKRQRQLAVLTSLRAGRIFPLRRLLEMTDYPDSREDKLLYYAQAHALVGLLLRLHDRATLLAFLEQVSPANVARRSPSWETVLAGLQKHYGIASEKALEQRWATFVQGYAPRGP